MLDAPLTLEASREVVHFQMANRQPTTDSLNCLSLRADRERAVARWERVERQLASRLAALVLLGCIMLFGVISTLVPQEPQVSPQEFWGWSMRQRLAPWLTRLGLTNIFSSWYFLTVAGLLSVNLAAATLRRARELWRGATTRRAPPVTARLVRSLREHRTCEGVLPLAQVRGRLRGFRWREGTGEEGAWLHGTRFGWACWWIIHFHAALLLILVGILVGQATGLRAYFSLTEGQAFTIGRDRFFQEEVGPLFRPGGRTVRVHLTRFDPQYRDPGYAKDIASQLRLANEEGAKEALLLRADKVSFGEFNIYQSAVNGFAPILRVQGADGRAQTGSIQMRFPSASERPRAEAKVPERDLLLYAEVLAEPPNFRSIPAMGDPRLKLTVWRGVERLGEITLEPGEPVRLGGETFTFLEIRHWSDFAVTRDLGVPLVYAGFLYLTLALLLALAMVPAEVFVFVDTRQGVTHVGARSARFRSTAHILLGRLQGEPA